MRQLVADLHPASIWRNAQMNDSDGDVRPSQQPGVDPTQVKRWADPFALAKKRYAESKKPRRA